MTSPVPAKGNDVASEPPDLSETADAIAGGRELVKQVQRSAEALDRQVEQAHATIEQSGEVLGRSRQLLNEELGSVKRLPRSGSAPSPSSGADAER